jgi:hypothetical protein
MTDLGKYIIADLVGNINDPERDAAIKKQNWKKVDESTQAQKQKKG